MATVTREREALQAFLNAMRIDEDENGDCPCGNEADLCDRCAHTRQRRLVNAADMAAAALAAPPPDETREALAILDELIELAESNIGRAQRLRDNPEFVQGDRVSYAVQAGVWGSLAETLKTRRAGFPPAAQAPPPDETRDYVAELRECHELLTSCVGGVDPDEHPELVARINLMLGNCDTAGVCPAKVDPVPGSADYWREVAARLSTEVHLLAKAVHELAERKAAQAPSPWGHPDLIEGLWTAGANLRATNGCEELAEHCDTAARLLTEGPPAAQAPPPDPPGLASLARSLAEALWDMQSAPDCWCPPDRSCTDGHTEACTAARAVNGAAKRFHLYNESPVPARHSDPPGLLAKLRERVKAWRAMASLLDKDDYPCGIELSDSLDECADQIDEMLAAHTAADPQAKETWQPIETLVNSDDADLIGLHVLGWEPRSRCQSIIFKNEDGAILGRESGEPLDRPMTLWRRLPASPSDPQEAR